MQISKTMNVNIPSSASWKIEKFSLLELFQVIEKEFTSLISASEEYQSVVVVRRNVVDETRFSFDEFKKHFSDSTPFESVSFMCSESLDEYSYFYIDFDKFNSSGAPYKCHVSITSSSLTEAEAEDFLKKLVSLSIPLLSTSNTEQKVHTIVNPTASSRENGDASYDSPNSEQRKKKDAFWGSVNKVNLIIGVVVGILTIFSFFGFRSCTQRNDLKNQTPSNYSETYFE